MNPPVALKSIWILALGTRGDVQPYVAVARAMAERGIKVRFYTSDEFVDFAKTFGLTAISLRLSMKEFASRHSKEAATAIDGNAHKVGDVLTLYNEASAESTAAVILRDVEAGLLPDLVVTSPMAKGIAWYLSLSHKVPNVDLLCQGVIYNPNHLPLGLPNLPFGLNYFMFYHVLTAMGYKMHLAYFGKDRLPLDLTKAFSLKQCIASMRDMRLPHIIMWSEELADALYPCRTSMHRFTGSPVIDKEDQCSNLTSFGGSASKQRIEVFLQAGPKPVYLGWGSMAGKTKESLMELAIKAVYHAQQRAILLGGYAELDEATVPLLHLSDDMTAYAQKNILIVEEAPHEWLFPQVAATVHHGGAGTTTAALRAGVPTIITPVVGDQFDHSRMVREMQLGVGFQEQLNAIHPEQLGEAIRTVVDDKDMHQRVAKLSVKLSAEEGADRAVDEITSFWNEYCVTGKFHEIFPGKASKTATATRWLSLAAVGGMALVAIMAYYGGSRQLF